MDVRRDMDRIRNVQARYGFDQDRTILTSQDQVAMDMSQDLPAEGLADGFPGRLIPVLFESETVEAIVQPSVGQRTGVHSHADSSGLHLVVLGRVLFRRPAAEQDKEVELGPGDWAYVPAEMPYEILIVENPARILYKHR